MPHRLPLANHCLAGVHLYGYSEDGHTTIYAAMVGGGQGGFEVGDLASAQSIGSSGDGADRAASSSASEGSPS